MTNSLEDLKYDYDYFIEKNIKSEVAAAILTLAHTIERKTILDRASCENFGHELALALKNVLQEEPVRAEVNINQVVDIEPIDIYHKEKEEE